MSRRLLSGIAQGTVRPGDVPYAIDPGMLNSTACLLRFRSTRPASHRVRARSRIQHTVVAGTSFRYDLRIDAASIIPDPYPKLPFSYRITTSIRRARAW